MNYSKKIVAFVLAVVSILCMCQMCLAQENVESYEMETVNIADFLDSDEGWGVSKGGEIDISDKVLSNGVDGMIYTGYQDESLRNRLNQFKMKLSFEENDGDEAWSGFSLRATSTKYAPWGGCSGYLFVIKHDRIELQKWLGNSTALDVVPNTKWKQGDEINISAGVLDTEEGFNVFLFIDGELVINCLDKSGADIEDGNGILFVMAKGTQVKEYDGGVIPSVPFGGKLEGFATEGENIAASYKLASFGGEKDEYTVNWYYSDKEIGTLSELDESAKKEFGKIYYCVGEYEDLNATGDTYTVKKEHIKGYYLAKVTDSAGNVVLEIPNIELNNENYLEENAIFLKLNCPYAYVKGQKLAIDSNDAAVVPALVNDRTLVPVRFIAENYGADVKWDDASQTVTITLDGKIIKMIINENKYTVDGKEFTLDVPAQLISARTMVPVRVISEAFEKTVFWDEERELIGVYGNTANIDIASEDVYLDVLDAYLTQKDYTSGK